MSRIKLKEQEVYEFRFAIKVRPQDINYAGHMGNDSFISLVGDARAQLFHSLGLSEMDLGDRQTGIIITDLVANYKAEAFMFDELLVEIHLDKFVQKGFRMFHRIRKGSKVIALVETGFAAYNYKTKKTAFIPPSFLQRLSDRDTE
jgi:acyl-CoA thioester hydrolase